LLEFNSFIDLSKDIGFSFLDFLITFLPSVKVTGILNFFYLSLFRFKLVFIPIPKKGNAKKCSNYHTFVLISHGNKVILKIFQTRLQQYINQELPDVQTVLRKGRATREQIANICWIIEKATEFQKNIYFSSLTTLKPFTLWLTANCGKFLKRWEHQTTLPVS